ncbi:hypothetical protein LOTGIDRAFT_197176 [Lottia gigantea]|uniref:Retinol dehydrogenase 13 n=1 Tax=Lottia gigantea TaxID=225164 RepID=V4B4Y3_LOTGI|nr:hypothetical protein LOTGIDRAFT_197176 [Lottia gigantea]ESO83499.1 hypothetical protein LOTGIDRAFT_197176 [Lottia gigantea]
MPLGIPPKYTVYGVIGFAVSFCGAIKYYSRGSKYKGKKNCLGKTFIVTGANSGIGRETAFNFAKEGGRVILACRDMEKCAAAKKEIINFTYNVQVICKKLDLASIKSIRQFAEEINKEETHVDVLVNNAGVMRCPETLTKDGIEMHLGVNHLGHFLLTNLLIEKLKGSVPSRVINVTCSAFVNGKINFKDLNSEDSYEEGVAYSQSKLALMLFTRELSKKLQGTGITVNAVHPGMSKTAIMRHTRLYNSKISSFFFWPIHFFVFKSVDRAAQTVLFAALDPSLQDVSGKYFSDCEEKEISENALNDEDAKRLWLTSEKWTRLT